MLGDHSHFLPTLFEDGYYKTRLAEGGFKLENDSITIGGISGYSRSEIPGEEASIYISKKSRSKSHSRSGIRGVRSEKSRLSKAQPW